MKVSTVISRPSSTPLTNDTTDGRLDDRHELFVQRLVERAPLRPDQLMLRGLTQGPLGACESAFQHAYHQVVGDDSASPRGPSPDVLLVKLDQLSGDLFEHFPHRRSAGLGAHFPHIHTTSIANPKGRSIGPDRTGRIPTSAGLNASAPFRSMHTGRRG
jgi:hypothetical protein